MSKRLAGVVVVFAYAFGMGLVCAADAEPAVVVIEGGSATGATELGPMRGALPARMAGWGGDVGCGGAGGVRGGGGACGDVGGCDG